MLVVPVSAGWAVHCLSTCSCFCSCSHQPSYVPLARIRHEFIGMKAYMACFVAATCSCRALRRPRRRNLSMALGCNAGRPGDWVAKLADFGLHATVDAQERDEKIQHLCVPPASRSTQSPLPLCRGLHAARAGNSCCMQTCRAPRFARVSIKIASKRNSRPQCGHVSWDLPITPNPCVQEESGEGAESGPQGRGLGRGFSLVLQQRPVRLMTGAALMPVAAVGSSDAGRWARLPGWLLYAC